LLDSGPNEPETLQNTFSQRALDKFGFIEAWAKIPRPFGPRCDPCPFLGAPGVPSRSRRSDLAAGVT
jgi:hypothetical protein